MSFAPVLPLSGYGGWTFLQRTLPGQTASFNRAPEVTRDADYFRARIGSIKTADQLVDDRRLLKVALGAFGLDADINAKAFIRKVLSDGTLKEGTLSGRLADKSYEKLSAAFGFGDFATPRTQLSTFATEILGQYKSRAFESAVGAQNGDLRLALNVQREVAAIAGKTTSSEDTKWFTIMGSAPLRTVFQKALGLPASLGSVDLDLQLTSYKARAKAVFGGESVSQFSDPAKVEGLVRRFLVRSEAESLSGSTGSGATALSMLQQTAQNGRNWRSSLR